MLDTKQDLKVTSLHVVTNGTQASAIDLYKRGFNVMPLPSAHDWKIRATAGNEHKKPPYLERPFFYARLHYHENCACKVCNSDESFMSLFERSNLAVMTGRTSGNLFAIDCDSQTAFDSIGKELEGREIPFWSITSHRGGAYLLRLIEGEAANVPKDKSHIPNIEIWGYHHYYLLPPSVHPLGTVYQWKSPEPRFCLPEGESIPPVSVASVEWLGVTLAIKKRSTFIVPNLAGLPEWTMTLSSRNRETLANGANSGNRNTLLTAVACDMVGNGIDYNVAEPALIKAADKCTPAYPHDETRAILKWAYSQPRTPAKQSEKATARTWQKAQEFATGYDWRKAYKQKAGTFRRVYLALIERARCENRSIFRASVRELSEHSNGVSKVRISDICRHLIEDGLLLYKGNDDAGTNLFSFPETFKVNTLSPPCRCSVFTSETQKDVFTQPTKTKSGLGCNAFQIWQHLVINPEKNASQTAKALNLSPSSTYTAFKRLLASGLITYSVERNLYFGESRTDAELEYLSIDLGTYGNSKERKEKYKAERERYVNIQTSEAKAKYNRKTQMILKAKDEKI